MSGTTVVSSKLFLLPIVIVLLFWLILVYQPLYNAIVIWVGNDIYNHCLIVIPASVYLIWEKRYVLTLYPWKPSWIAFICFLMQLLLYTLGTAADVQLFQHAALFSMLPTLFWLFAGNKIAWNLKFPLLFWVFAIPIGEELIPFLQEITADMSVVMLQWSGVPLFRSGLFIEIPQGKFLVAEACSGVSFLIASIVLGNLYAYMNLTTWRYRIFFALLSIIFPILANAIRVYGIIMIGYLSDMKHAVGADHLIYGWFFFAFVLVCLFFIGELIRRIEKSTRTAQTSDANKPAFNRDNLPRQVSTPSVVIICALFSLALWQDYRMQNIQPVAASTNIELRLDFSEQSQSSSAILWEPVYTGATQQGMQHYLVAGKPVDLFYSIFANSEAEVVSSLHRLYQQERWSLVARSVKDVGNISVNRLLIASATGIRREIFFWYEVNQEKLRTAKQVKLAQALNTLSGRATVAAIYAVALDVPRESLSIDDQIVDQIIPAIFENLEKVNQQQQRSQMQ